MSRCGRRHRVKIQREFPLRGSRSRRPVTNYKNGSQPFRDTEAQAASFGVPDSHQPIGTHFPGLYFLVLRRPQLLRPHTHELHPDVSRDQVTQPADLPDVDPQGTGGSQAIAWGFAVARSSVTSCRTARDWAVAWVATYTIRRVGALSPTEHRRSDQTDAHAAASRHPLKRFVTTVPVLLFVGILRLRSAHL